MKNTLTVLASWLLFCLTSCSSLHQIRVLSHLSESQILAPLPDELNGETIIQAGCQIYSGETSQMPTISWFAEQVPNAYIGIKNQGPVKIQLLEDLVPQEPGTHTTTTLAGEDLKVFLHLATPDQCPTADCEHLKVSGILEIIRQGVREILPVEALCGC